jgi:DNA-binding NarL/FixJ family response regulator
MPHFEPLTAIREIRQRYPQMRILVISAYDDDFYVQGLLKAGVDGYYLKGQSLNDLRLALQRVFAGEKWVSSSIVDKLLTYTEVPADSPLTTRQREILRLLQQGYDNQSIAHNLNLSIKTIENHLTRLYRQLNVSSRLEAVKLVNQHPGLLATWGQEAALALDPELSMGHKQVRALIVDDNARYRHRLKKMIGRVCPRALIYEAGDINEAVERAERVSPHLAFVDVILGDESGIHCTRRLKTIVPEARVILISAYPDREFHRSGIEAGAIAFLDKKAVDAESLTSIIDDLADRCDS